MLKDTKGSVTRRKALRGVATGVAFAGLGVVSGVVTAETDDFDEGTEVIDGERIPDEETKDYYEIAMKDGGVQALVDKLTDYGLEPQPEDIVGTALVTDDDDYNERNPINIHLPFEGDRYGRCSMTVVDEGDLVGGIGQVLVPEGDDYVGRIYALEDGEPVLEREVEYGEEIEDHPEAEVIKNEIYNEPVGEVNSRVEIHCVPVCVIYDINSGSGCIQWEMWCHVVVH